MQSRIGFVGLGSMGLSMAKNIKRAGFPLMVYDVRPAAMKALVAKGASEADSVSDVGRSCDVVITCLPVPSVSEEVILGPDGLVSSMKRGSVLIELSVVAPSRINRFGKATKSRGINLLDCAVTGGAKAAAERKVHVLVGGNERIFKRCEPILKAIGEQVYYLGGLGSAETMKLLNNIMVWVNRAAVIETLRVAAKTGANPKQLFEIVSTGTGQSWVWNRWLSYMANGKKLGIKVENSLAGVESAMEMAKDLGVETPLLDAVHRIYLDLIANGMGKKDMSEISRYFKKTMNLDMRFETPLL